MGKQPDAAGHEEQGAHRAAPGEVPEAARCVETDPGLPLGRQREGRLPADWTLFKCTNGFAGQNAAIVLRSARD